MSQYVKVGLIVAALVILALAVGQYAYNAGHWVGAN